MDRGGGSEEERNGDRGDEDASNPVRASTKRELERAWNEARSQQSARPRRHPGEGVEDGRGDVQSPPDPLQDLKHKSAEIQEGLMEMRAKTILDMPTKTTRI